MITQNQYCNILLSYSLSKIDELKNLPMAISLFLIATESPDGVLSLYVGEVGMEEEWVTEFFNGVVFNGSIHWRKQINLQDFEVSWV